MNLVPASDVFVPGKFPKYTYNPRTELRLEENLKKYMNTGGTILTVAGPTKTGKSVLLHKIVSNPVWIEVAGIDSADAFWRKVGDELGTVASIEREEHTDSTRAGDARASVSFLNVIQVEGGAGATSGAGAAKRETTSRSPDYESKKALVESLRPLVVDDFHFIPFTAQREIIRSVKPLVFDGMRVIFASITHRGNDVVSAVADMAARVTPLKIGFWSEAELIQIARDGFAVLNVSDRNDALATKLASTSFGSPHIMQKLCLELCEEINGVSMTLPESRQLMAPTDWDSFFKDLVEDASAIRFKSLKRGPQERGSERTKWTLKDGRSLDGYGLTLAAIASTGPKLTLTKDEIKIAVRSIVRDDAPAPNQTTRVLIHMSKMAAKRASEAPESEEELDIETGLPPILDVQPVLEYVEDDTNSALHLVDPFFAYYLRWGSSD